MWYGWEKRELITEFWFGNLNNGESSEDLGLD